MNSCLHGQGRSRLQPGDHGYNPRPVAIDAKISLAEIYRDSGI